MKTSEAAERVCPFQFSAGVVERRCIGAQCMAWRKRPALDAAGRPLPAAVSVPEGDCELIARTPAPMDPVIKQALSVAAMSMAPGLFTVSGAQFLPPPEAA